MLAGNDAILSEDGIYRYALSREVEAPVKGLSLKLLWVMVNPSTASATADDHTIRKCLGYARRWGFASMRVVNLYAFRTPHVEVLAEKARTGIDIVGPHNDEHISEQATWADQIVCAWGDRKKVKGVEVGPRIERVLKVLRAATHRTEHPIFSIGLTQGGDPIHPLTTPYDAIRQEYGR